MRRSTARRALVPLLLAFAACGVMRHGLPVESPRATDGYNAALSTYTRSAEVDENLTRLLTVVATFQAPGFLRARFEEEARYKMLPAEAARARLEAFRAEHPGPTVVIFFDAVDPDAEDLDRPDSATRIALRASGRDWDAEEIVRLDSDDPALRHLFPYVTDFGKLYLARFPADAPESGADLVVAGPLSQIVLEF